jgi:hypothetical protein
MNGSDPAYRAYRAGTGEYRFDNSFPKQANSTTTGTTGDTSMRREARMEVAPAGHHGRIAQFQQEGQNSPLAVPRARRGSSSVRRGIALLAAATCLVAGCSYKLDPNLSRPTPPVATIPASTTTLPPTVPLDPDPRRAILNGREKVLEAGTVQMRISAAVVGGEPEQIAGKGGFDLPKRAGTLTLTLPNDEGTMAVVNVGDIYYVKSPRLTHFAAGKPWVGANVASLPIQQRQLLLANARLPATSDPASELRLLDGLTGAAEDLGSDVIRGLGPVRGYRMTTDLLKLAPELQPDRRRRFQQLDMTSMTMDLWLDGFGYLRRLRYQLEKDRLRSAPAVAVTADFSGFGTPVKITIPPASKVQLFGA